MFAFMLMFYNHYTYIIQVTAVHSTASECSKSHVDHMAALMRHQQTQAVQHNGHDTVKGYIVAWLNTGNSRHIIHHTKTKSCQLRPKCNHHGTAQLQCTATEWISQHVQQEWCVHKYPSPCGLDWTEKIAYSAPFWTILHPVQTIHMRYPCVSAPQESNIGLRSLFFWHMVPCHCVTGAWHFKDSIVVLKLGVPITKWHVTITQKKPYLNCIAAKAKNFKHHTAKDMSHINISRTHWCNHPSSNPKNSLQRGLIDWCLNGCPPEHLQWIALMSSACSPRRIPKQVWSEEASYNNEMSISLSVLTATLNTYLTTKHKIPALLTLPVKWCPVGRVRSNSPFSCPSSSLSISCPLALNSVL